MRRCLTEGMLIILLKAQMGEKLGGKEGLPLFHGNMLVVDGDPLLCRPADAALLAC